MGILSKIKNRISDMPTLFFPRIFYGHNDSSNGININDSNLLTINTVYSCIKVLSETIAALPLELQNKDDKETIKSKKHPLYKLVNLSPNKEMTSFMWRQFMMIQVLAFGNSVSQIIKNRKGEVIEIYPMDWRKMQIIRDKKDNRLLYKYNVISTVKKEYTLEQSEVIHLRMFNSESGIIGTSLTEYQKENLGLSKLIQNFASNFFKNGATPTGCLEVTDNLNDKEFEKVQKHFEEQTKGNSNSHIPLILEGGMTFKPLNMSNEESQFLETRKFERSTISSFFRVPLHFINDLEKATFSNIEHQDLAFEKHTIRPWIINWNQELQTKLLTKEEYENGYFFYHNTDSLREGDYKSKQEALAIQRQNGVITTNEWRKKNRLDPIDGGNQLLINGNMIPLDSKLQKEKLKNR